MRPRKMLVHHFPFHPQFCKHMPAPPVDLVPSPELHAPIECPHRRPSVHRHVRLLHGTRASAPASGSSQTSCAAPPARECARASSTKTPRTPGQTVSAPLAHPPG